MIEDCTVNVEAGAYGIKITQIRKGFFNNVSAKPKAALFPNCGYLGLYVDEFSQ